MIKLKKENKENKVKKNSQLLTIIGCSIIFIGVSICVWKVATNHYLNKQDKEKIEEFFELEKEQLIRDVEVNIEEKEEEIVEEEVVNKPSTYLGVLEIPKIKVKNGYYNIGDSNNNVNKNIQLIEKSDTPDTPYGVLILAGHSGDSRVGYFKNLYKLENKDKAYIYYSGKKYIYELVNSYEVEKNGQVSIRRDSDITSLALITCNQKDKTKQVVYIFKLVGEEKYE